MTIQNRSGRRSGPRFRCLLAVGLALAPTLAMALDIQLPAETATYQPSDLPGYALVQSNCLICHSAQYVISQPRTSPRSYWEATVHKMKKPFGAPLKDEDMPAIVDYLSRTYGAESSATAAAPAALQKVSATTPAPAASAPTRDASTLMSANGCTACHAVDHKIVGPAFKDVAARYRGKPDALTEIAKNIRGGGSGKWGPTPMPPFPGLSDAELKTLAESITSH